MFHYIVDLRLYFLGPTHHNTDILVFFLQRPLPLGVRIVFRILLDLIVILAHVRCSNARRANQNLISSFCDRKLVCSFESGVAVALNSWKTVLAIASLEGTVAPYIGAGSRNSARYDGCGGNALVVLHVHRLNILCGPQRRFSRWRSGVLSASSLAHGMIFHTKQCN